MTNGAIVIRYMDMPHVHSAFTSQDNDGNYNIYINSRLSFEMQQAAYLHELKHINKDDFHSIKHVREIEWED